MTGDAAAVPADISGADSRPGRYDAILLTNANMHPTFPIDSVVFLGRSQFHWDGYYAIFPEGAGDGAFGGVYRVQRSTAGLSFRLDGVPAQLGFEIPLEHAASMGIRQVAGVAKPLCEEFGHFLRDRSRDRWEGWP